RLMKSICKAKMPNSRLRSASGRTGVSPGMASYFLWGGEEHEPDALAKAALGGEKGVRHLLCEAPSGPFRQKVPDPFFAAWRQAPFVRSTLRAVPAKGA